MAELPLIRDLKDIFYRYKMPKLIAKFEGKGNGRKTVIVNMEAISKALNRPAMYIAKFFGYELGTTVSTLNNQYIINGEHNVEVLITHLYEFINKFVICPKCKNPETDLEIVSENINQKCRSCGYKAKIASSIHKITNYIIKHPSLPMKTKPIKAESSQILKKMAVKSQIVKKSSMKNAAVIDNAVQKTDDCDEDWSDDEEYKSVDIDVNRNSDELISASIESNANKTPAEKAEIFLNSINAKRSANLLDDVNTQKELFNEAAQLGLRDKAPFILAKALFTENMLTEVKQYDKLFIKFCDENEASQKSLLKAFEIIIGDVYKESLFSKSEAILNKFYEADIVDEDVFIDWAENISAKHVPQEVALKIRQKTGRFIAWLKKPDSGYNFEPLTHNNQIGLEKKEKESHGDLLDIEYSQRADGVKVENIKPLNAEDNLVDINIDII